MATSILDNGKQDVSLIALVGVIALLFLAVAVHEGFFSSSSSSNGGDGLGVGSTSDGITSAPVFGTPPSDGGFFSNLWGEIEQFGLASNIFP